MLFSDLYVEVTAALERRAIDFLVAGGVAVGLHGIRRSTDDLDLVIDAERRADAIAALEELGFTSLRQMEGFSNHARRGAGDQRVDLLYVRSSTRTQLFERAVRVEYGGRSYPVVDPHHLCAMKLFAVSQNPGRTYSDLADVRELISARLVDKDEILRYLDRYGLREHATTLGLRA